MKKRFNFSYKVFMALLLFLLAVVGFAEADFLKDLLVKDNNDAKTIQDLYTVNGNKAFGNQAKPSIVIVDFFDNNCLDCRIISPALKKIVNDHPEVQIVFKEHPILGDDSQLAALAAQAAEKQNQYLSMHNAMMASKTHINLAEIKRIALKLKLDIQKLIDDIDSAATAKQLAENAALAEKLQVNSVPTLFITNTRILTTQNPESIRQYRWTGQIDAKKFSILLADLEK